MLKKDGEEILLDSSSFFLLIYLSQFGVDPLEDMTGEVSKVVKQRTFYALTENAGQAYETDDEEMLNIAFNLASRSFETRKEVMSEKKDGDDDTSSPLLTDVIAIALTKGMTLTDLKYVEMGSLFDIFNAFKDDKKGTGVRKATQADWDNFSL